MQAAALTTADPRAGGTGAVWPGEHRAQLWFGYLRQVVGQPRDPQQHVLQRGEKLTEPGGGDLARLVKQRLPDYLPGDECRAGLGQSRDCRGRCRRQLLADRSRSAAASR
jgi:hypothetical protein